MVTVALCSSSTTAAAATIEPGIQDVDITGSGDAIVANGNQYIWASEPTNFEVTVQDYVTQSESYYQSYTVRLTRQPDDDYASTGEQSLAVDEIRLAELATGNVSLAVPGGELDPGVHNLWVSMYKPGPGANPRVSEARITVRVITKMGDADNDGLDNIDEVNGDTSFLSADTDGDGLSDGRERRVFDTDPTLVDTDGDGLDDPQEVSEQTNPHSPDTDSDTANDVTELLNNTSPTAEDTDFDGLPDVVELELGTDPRDSDTDGDGLSDYTEVQRTNTNPLDVDTDGDGLEDAMEIWRYGTNPRSSDTDNDGVSDAREVLIGTNPTSPPAESNGQATSDAQSQPNAPVKFTAMMFTWQLSPATPDIFTHIHTTTLQPTHNYSGVAP
jgi:hypothetical protein